MHTTGDGVQTMASMRQFLEEPTRAVVFSAMSGNSSGRKRQVTKKLDSVIQEQSRLRSVRTAAHAMYRITVTNSRLSVLMKKLNVSRPTTVNNAYVDIRWHKIEYGFITRD